jgi:hypothetical protein
VHERHAAALIVAASLRRCAADYGHIRARLLCNCAQR